MVMTAEDRLCAVFTQNQIEEAVFLNSDHIIAVAQLGVGKVQRFEIWTAFLQGFHLPHLPFVSLHKGYRIFLGL